MELLSVDGHLDTICKYRNWLLSRDMAGNTTVEVLLEGGGSHLVTLIKRLDPGGVLTVQFVADVCHESKVDNPEKMLKESGFMNHGVFSLMNNRLVILDTQIDQTADIEEVAAILIHLASYAKRFLNKLALKEQGIPSLGTIKGGPRAPR